MPDGFPFPPSTPIKKKQTKITNKINYGKINKILIKIWRVKNISTLKRIKA